MKKFLKKRQKMLVLVGVAAIGIAAAAFSYYRINQPVQTTEPINGEKAVEEKGSSPASSNSSSSSQEKASGNEAPATTPQPAASFNITLVRAGQVGNSVQVRALVDGVTSGTCTVTFTGPGKSFSKSSPITHDAQSYSCGALNAKSSDFSVGGSWSYSLIAINGGKHSNTLKGNILVSK